MVASAHHVITKEVENRVFQDKCIFRHTRIYKEHKLTRHWTYNNSVQILYSYLRYTDRLCGCVFLVARYNIISASSSFLCHFLSLFLSRLSLSSSLNLLGKNIFAPKGRSLPPSVYSLCDMIIILSS